MVANDLRHFLRFKFSTFGGYRPANAQWFVSGREPLHLAGAAAKVTEYVLFSQLLRQSTHNWQGQQCLERQITLCNATISNHTPTLQSLFLGFPCFFPFPIFLAFLVCFSFCFQG